ncbi:hypothetical protein IJ182_08385 [bacterium]|nr:hypothetical protein [bacterium]
MSSPIATQSNTRAGLCPHGLPPAACPICSGGGMGGAGKMRDTAQTKPMRSTEWSFMKCYAAGLAMRAQEARAENSKNVFEKQIEFAKQLGQEIRNLANRIQNAIKNIQNTMPPLVQNVIQVLNNIIITPLLNMLSQIPKIIEKFAQFQQRVGEFIQQAGEKLAAILGDIKNFIERNIIENVKKKAKKFFLFFMSNIEDENYKNDETLAIFKAREMKKFIVKILKKNKKRDNNAD